jgi:cell division inhibitor SepF
MCASAPHCSVIALHCISVFLLPACVRVRVRVEQCREITVAGWFKSTAAYLGLVEDEQDLESTHQETRPESRREPGRSEIRSATLQRVVPAVAADVSSVPEPGPAAMGEVTRIVTLHPRSYNDARRIGEEYREGIPVIMNLTEMDDSDAKRIVDFAAGLAFGLHGTIERVTSKVFLLSPANVDVGAAARAQMTQDFYNQS